MDKIFMKIVMAQGSIDIIFNAYQRHHAFALTDNDMVSYLDYFIKILDDIEGLMLEYNIIPSEAV